MPSNSDLVGLKLVHDVERGLLRRVLLKGWVTDWTLAVDGGAHIGGWSDIMANRFDDVVAFEPDGANFTRLYGNMKDRPNVRTINGALMDKLGFVEVFSPGRDTSTAKQVRMVPGGDGTVACYPLDQFGYKTCGLIKLDLEGSEMQALRGAENTIQRCRPVLIVELSSLSQRMGFEAHVIRKWILDRGYTRVWKENVNEVFIPEEKRP